MSRAAFAAVLPGASRLMPSVPSTGPGATATTRILYVETPANPTLAIVDVAAIVALIGWTLVEGLVIAGIGIFRREPA